MIECDEMDWADEIKKCPYCGGDVHEHFVDININEGGEDVITYLHCHQCGEVVSEHMLEELNDNEEFANMVSALLNCVESLKNSSETSINNVDKKELKMLLQNAIEGFDQVIMNLEKITEIENVEI